MFPYTFNIQAQRWIRLPRKRFVSQKVVQEASGVVDHQGWVSFAHGTSIEQAQQILQNGVDETSGRQQSKGGAMSHPGWFHTWGLGPPDAPGLGFQLAYEMGHRHSDQPVVFIFRIPTICFEGILRRGFVKIEEITEEFPSNPQVVFSPQTFPLLNQEGWAQIIDPYKRPGTNTDWLRLSETTKE